MKKKTVRTWYAFLVFFAILLSVVVVGAFGIFTLWGKTNRDVVTIMNLTTESKADEMNLVLLKIRDAVDTVGAYIGARVVSSNMQLDEDVIQGGLDEEIQELFQSTVENIDGATGYYIRFAEPYNDEVEGFAFRKNTNAASFSPVTQSAGMWVSDTSINVEEEDDWYELAKESGSPVWIPIRESSYNDGYIFSYAVPFYFEQELVGVACVDVDFEALAEPVREVSIFDNGYAYLTNDEGKVYYHPLIGYGVLLTEDEEDVPEVDSALADTSTHGKLISYKYKGQNKKMTFQSLLNDMRLVVTANEEDIEHETIVLIRNIVLSSIAIVIIVMLLAILIEKKTMHPVLDKMDNLAHLDGLTGIQNRTSFLEMQASLNQKIQEGTAVFGFAMFDANNLKKINDQFGHKFGDAYLLGVVEMIQDCFPGYQAYRIGGDEFVVLMEGEASLKESEKCMACSAEWQEKRRKTKKDPWERPSVASAFAEYDPQSHHSSEEVLAEADTKMYQNKQQMKAQGL